MFSVFPYFTTVLRFPAVVSYSNVTWLMLDISKSVIKMATS